MSAQNITIPRDFLAVDDDLEGSCNELSLMLSMLRERWFARDFQSIKSRTFVNSSFRFHVSILQLSIFFFMIRMGSKFSPLVGICTFRSGIAKLSSLLDGEHGLVVAVLEVHSEDLVDLVEHLGGSQVVRGKVGVLAGSTLDTIQLFLGS